MRAEQGNIFIKFTNGDKFRFRHIFGQYYRPLCYFASRIIGNKSEAEDIVTETFIKILHHSKEFNSPAELRSFLYTITRNACCDYLRRQKIREKAFLELSGTTDTDVSVTDNEMIFAKVIEGIYAEVENLPEQCRKVFKGLFMEGKSTEVIANEMGIGRQTVLNYKARAIQLLKLILYREHILAFIIVLAIILS